MNSSNNTRVEWIDTAKGFCILLVALNHVLLYCGIEELCPPIFINFLSSFRMPLYFFLSGLFFKSYSSSRFFITKKTNKLIIPFLFFYIIFSIITPFIIISTVGFFPFLDNNTKLCDLVFDFYNNDCQLVNGPLWFLLCLFEINIVFYLIHFICKNDNYIYLISAICGLAGLILCYYQIDLICSLDTALTAMPFFCFGYFTKSKTNILYHSAVDKHLIVLSIVCGIFCLLCARHVQYYNNYFYNTSYFTAHICGIIGTMMVIFISKRIGKLSVISYFGRYSIIILCTHILIVKTLVYFLEDNFVPIVNAIIIFPTLLLSELIIIPFSIKYLPYVTAQKDVLICK